MGDREVRKKGESTYCQRAAADSVSINTEEEASPSTGI